MRNHSHALLIALPLLVTCVEAQQLSLAGKVLDATGSVPGAQVTVRSTSGTRSTLSDANGSYVFAALDHGSYTLHVEASGYRFYDTELALDESRNVDVHLEVAGITSTVNVSAARIEQDEQSVPASVTALGPQAVRDSRIESFSTIHEYVPNMRYADYAGRGVYGFLTIRGVGNSFSSVEPSATVFVDGVPITDFFSYSQQLYDIEHIEVLRGPQSTLYGSFAEAGVVNIFTRMPDERLRASIRQEYGNFNSYSTMASISGPIIRNKLFLEGAGNVSGSDGPFRNSFTGKRFGEFAESGRIRLRYTPIERFDVVVGVTGQTIDDQGGQLAFPIDNIAYSALPSVAPFRNGNFDVAYDAPGYRKTGTNAQSIVARYTGDQFQLVSTTARRENGIRKRWDYDGTPSPYFIADSDSRPHEFYQEVRIQSPGSYGRGFSYVAGVSYNRSRQPANASVTDELGMFGGPAGFAYSVYTTQLNADTYGGYGQITKRFLSQRLGVTAGVRFDDAERKVNALPADLLGPGFRLARSSHRILPKIALDYGLGGGVMIYGSAAAGWKPGGVNPFADSAANAMYNEEHSWNYEGGLKSSLLKERVTLNLAAFHNRINNYQDSVQRSSLQFLIGNAQVATVNGFEAEVSYRPLPGLEIHGGYGLARARYQRYLVNPATGFNYDGQRIPQIPDSNSNIVVQYSLPGHLLLRGEMIAATNYVAYKYTAPTPSTPQSFERATVDGYSLGNLRLGYESSRYELTAYVNNIADTRYFLQASATPAFGYSGFFGSLGLPRTYGFRAAFRFH
jgi:iron complex outermembrane receptor protein